MLDITLRILAARLREKCDFIHYERGDEESEARREARNAEVRILDKIADAIDFALDEVKKSIETLHDS